MIIAKQGLLFLCVTLLLSQMVGCSAAKPAKTQSVDKGLVVDEMDFLDYMVRKPKCTVADAVRGVCLLSKGSDVGKTYAECYQYLRERKAVRDAWKLEPDQWIDRGTLAFMLLRTANLGGGVNMRIFASWGLGDRRFAYREMCYRALMPDGVSYQVVSGPEFVTTLGKVDRFMMKRGEYSASKEAELGNKSQYE